MQNIKVISMGGSIVAPDEINVSLLRKFNHFVSDYLTEDTERKLIIVVGGGGPARKYQKAYREIAEKPENMTQDWIGITATRLNAQLLAGVFEQFCSDPVVIDPTGSIEFSGRVLVGAGWKPGFSTDYDAVLLAERFKAKMVINLSNIKKVYTADPKIDPNAKPIDSIGWSDFRKIVGDEWTPGKNLPFDPVATKKAAEMGLQVIVASGNDIENIAAILEGRDFQGTQIGPG